MSYGGTDSSNGTYGPVGASTGSEPQPSSGGTAGPAGPPGPPGPYTPKAATFVVSPTPGVGDFMTIQEAVNALPEEGGYIFVREGTYVLSSTITLADKNIIFMFAAGAILDPGSGAFAVFTVPDVLTELRYFRFSSPSLEGNGTPGQDFIQIADTHGLADILIDNPYIEFPDTLINFTAYDETFSRVHRVKVRGGWVFPNGNNSTLVKTPHPNGSYSGSVIITFEDVGLSDEAVAGFNNVNQAWGLDIDGDIVFKSQGTAWTFGLKPGGCDGFAALGCAGIYMGNGDFVINGSGWYGVLEIRASYLAGGAGFPDCRVVCHDVGMAMQPGYIADVAIKFLTNPGNITVTEIVGSHPLNNPAIEIASDSGRVANCRFKGFGGSAFSNGAIKITGVQACKIHDNGFEGVTQKTILEVAPGNNNLVHDNTGVTSGTGMTLAGAATIANAHNNI